MENYRENLAQGVSPTMTHSRAINLSFLCTQQHSRKSPTPSEKGLPEENEFEVYNFLLH